MIDAHHHFAPPNTSTPTQVTLDQLESDLDLCAIDQLISVQHTPSLTANNDLLQLAQHSDSLISAIIAWAPIHTPMLRPTLNTFLHQPLIAGLHEDFTSAHTADLLDHPDFHQGLSHLHQQQLTFELTAHHHQLNHIIQLADHHPDLPIAICHSASPPPHNTPDFKSWQRNVRELARRPHVFCKTSSLTHLLPSSRRPLAHHLSPYFDTLLNAFSPQRLLYASDWPNIPSPDIHYPQWLNLIDELTLNLSQNERDHIFELSATSFYSLPRTTPDITEHTPTTSPYTHYQNYQFGIPH